MLTAPLRELLHWKSYKMPRPDQPDGLRRMPGPVAGLHGDRVGELRHQAGPSVGRARTTSCSTSRTPGPSQARRCQPRCYRSKIASLGQSAFGCSSRRDGQLHNFRKLHEGDRGTGQGDSVGRLLGSLEDLGKAAAVSGSTPVNNIPVNIRTRR